MLTIIVLLLIALTAALWISAMRAKETAVQVCKNACAQRGLQLLDDTVSLKKLGFKRGIEGTLQWQRTYQFDYCANSDERQSSTITLVGTTVVELSLNPKNNIIQFARAKNDSE